MFRSAAVIHRPTRPIAAQERFSNQNPDYTLSFHANFDQTPLSQYTVAPHALTHSQAPKDFLRNFPASYLMPLRCHDASLAQTYH